VLSSVTCQYGVFAAERFQAKREGSLWQISKWGMREWFALTFLMGAFFIAGQVYEYAVLVSENLSLSSNAYGSVILYDYWVPWSACDWRINCILNRSN